MKKSMSFLSFYFCSDFLIIRSVIDKILFWFDELFCGLAINYLFFMVLPFVTDPEAIVAEGLHQPIFLCNVTEHYNSIFGTVSSCY